MILAGIIQVLIIMGIVGLVAVVLATTGIE
jgi:hypothetical protein